MRLFVARDAGGGVPDAVVVGPYVVLPLPLRSVDRLVVLAQSMTSPPAGTLDLGDPLDEVWMFNTLNPGQTRGIESELGERRDSWRGFTCRQMLTAALDHASGFVWVQPRHASRPWTAEDIDPVFTQTKPVL